MKKTLVLLALTSLACAQEPLLEIGKWLPQGVANLKVSADGRHLIVFPHYYDDQGRNLELWRVSDGQRIAELHKPAQHLSAAFAPDQQHVVAIAEEMVTPAYYASRGYVWDLEGKPVGKPAAVAGDLAEQTVPPSPDSLVIYTWQNKEKGDENGGIRWAEGQIQLWHWPTGKIRTIGGVRARLQAAAVSPDGRYASSSGGDTMSGLWDTRSGKLVYRNYGDAIQFTSLPGRFYTNKQILALPSLARLGRVPETVRREASGKTLYSLGKTAKVLDPNTLKPLRAAKVQAGPGFQLENARAAGSLSGDRLLLWDSVNHAAAILSP